MTNKMSVRVHVLISNEDNGEEETLIVAQNERLLPRLQQTYGRDKYFQCRSKPIGNNDTPTSLRLGSNEYLHVLTPITADDDPNMRDHLVSQGLDPTRFRFYKGGIACAISEYID